MVVISRVVYGIATECLLYLTTLQLRICDNIASNFTLLYSAILSLWYPASQYTSNKNSLSRYILNMAIRLKLSKISISKIACTRVLIMKCKRKLFSKKAENYLIVICFPVSASSKMGGNEHNHCAHSLSHLADIVVDIQ